MATTTFAEIQAVALERLAYDKKEVRALLGGISNTTLWRLHTKGLLSPVPHLGRTIYAKTEVERFLRGAAKGAVK